MFSINSDSRVFTISNLHVIYYLALSVIRTGVQNSVTMLSRDFELLCFTRQCGNTDQVRWEMNIPCNISDILPSTCQKLLKVVKICLSSDKKKSAQFFQTRCSSVITQLQNRSVMRISLEHLLVASSRLQNCVICIVKVEKAGLSGRGVSTIVDVINWTSSTPGRTYLSVRW